MPSDAKGNKEIMNYFRTFKSSDGRRDEVIISDNLINVRIVIGYVKARWIFLLTIIKKR